MRGAIPVIVGVIMALLGIVFAAQGAGMIGGSSLMNNNPAFIYVGGLFVIAGFGLVALGARSKPKSPTSAPV